MIKQIKNEVLLLIVGLMYLLNIDQSNIDPRYYKWLKGQIPKPGKFKRNNRNNRAWAKKVNEGNYGFMIILYDLVWKKAKNGRYILMPTLPNPNQVVKGVLNMTGNNKSETVAIGRQIIFDCTGNATVTVAVPLLSAGTTAIDNYDGAHGSEVAEYYREMIDALEPILALFNNFVKIPANRLHSVSTLQSGGFHVVGPGGSHLAVFGVRVSVVAGEFLLTGDVDHDGKDGLHLWWYSLDGIIWVPMRSTKKNKTKMGGFTRGQLVFFKHELVIDDDNNPYPVSDPISRTAN